MAEFDALIIGAGIAGSGLAAFLAPKMRLAILEAEAQPGYHTTGRSAAFWSESYGEPDVQPLTSASGPWLRNPPKLVSDRSLLSPRGALTLGNESEEDALKEFYRRFDAKGVAMQWLERSDLERRIAGLDRAIRYGVYERDCQDIDVATLHLGYLRMARQSGAKLLCHAPMRRADFANGIWRIDAGEHRLSAPLLINAAGAWAGQMAEIAGQPGYAIQPMRRTMVQLRTHPAPPHDLPLILGIAGDYYFKPQNGRLWLSPHDETPSTPCDAAPEELDIARAIARFEQIVDWQVEAIEHRWAGLRSFAPDRLPVAGFRDRQHNYFALVGQGGFGIQTSPALSSLSASLICGEMLDQMAEGIDSEIYGPQRFSEAGCIERKAYPK